MYRRIYLDEGIFDSKKDKEAKYQKLIANTFEMKFSEAMSYIKNTFEDVLLQCQLYKDTGGNAINTYHGKKDTNATNLRTHVAEIKKCASKNAPLTSLVVSVSKIASAFGVDYNSDECKELRAMNLKLNALGRDKDGQKALDYITKTIYDRLAKSINGFEKLLRENYRRINEGYLYDNFGDFEVHKLSMDVLFPEGTIVSNSLLLRLYDAISNALDKEGCWMAGDYLEDEGGSNELSRVYHDNDF